MECTYALMDGTMVLVTVSLYSNAGKNCVLSGKKTGHTRTKHICGSSRTPVINNSDHLFLSSARSRCINQDKACTRTSFDRYRFYVQVVFYFLDR